jgi:hypothetical protein
MYMTAGYSLYAALPIHEVENSYSEMIYHVDYLCDCSIVKRLNTNRDNLGPTFRNVVNEMFVDNQYNWGRVVTVYAFGGWLARNVCCSREFDSTCADKTSESKDPDCAAEIAKLTGEFVAERLGGWVRKQGGWVSTIFLLG